jgi:uncharacterized Zn-binding protein involved in type VI secretion
MPPAARVTDMHVCPMVTGVVPHVGGPILPPGVPTVLIDFLPAATVTDMATCVGPPDVIVMGSTGVFINFLPAARLGDPTAHGGVIVVGSPTCIIGEVGSPSPGAAGLGGIVGGLTVAGVLGRGATSDSVVLGGSPMDQKRLKELVKKIRNSGPKGKAFVEGLEKNSKKTHLFIGKSATKKDGTVISLASTGGGITLRPSESKSGDNEVHIDPTNLINYVGADGNTVKETPEGLLLHEMGHAKLLNDGDPAQTSGGSMAEQNVRTETNPIRSELGMKAER